MSRIISAQGYCDCCDKLATLSRCWAAGGIETFACAECRGFEADAFDDDDEQQQWMNDYELKKSGWWPA